MANEKYGSDGKKTKGITQSWQQVTYEEIVVHCWLLLLFSREPSFFLTDSIMLATRN
jgi:hypothetical protein